MAGQRSYKPDLDEGHRASLAEMIDRRAAEIESRWLDLVRVDIVSKRPQEPTPTELRDALGDYLSRLAITLREPNLSSNEREGSEVWGEVAREHAVTRVRLGFDIDQLVHEFILLRRILVDFARKDGLIPDGQQAERLTDLIEAAIAVAVKSYVEFRDYQFRKLEAEHIGFITHELRNPLSVAAMAGSEICRRLGNTNEFDKLCESLVNSHQRLKELIENVLFTERLETQNVEIRPIDTTLGAVLDRSLQNAKNIALLKKLDFCVTADRQIPLHVDMDLTVSVIQNLIENAVKYTDSGRVAIESEESEAEVIIHFRDGCHGISAEDLDIIFEPFRRGHSRKPGTGLGLAIARQAIELQGGHVYAESLDNTGCHFWIRIPKKVVGQADTRQQQL